MSSFNDFAGQVKDGAIELAKDLFDGFEKQAAKDAAAFLEKTKQDLKRWTTLLAHKEITEEDFSDLVHAKKALAEIHALRQAGIALIKLEKFRSGLVNLVIDRAFAVFL